MKKLRRYLRFFVLFGKRHLKHPTSIVILLCIPLLMLSFSLIAREDSGVLTISVLSLDEPDSFSYRLAESLVQTQENLRFLPCENIDHAIELVESGRCDAAWIFVDHFEEKLSDFVRHPSPEKAVVKILLREKSVSQLLVNEVLFGKIYPLFSQETFLSYAKEQHALADISKEELLKYYDETLVEGENLFSFSYLKGDVANETVGYLVSPIRGLLGILILVSGLGAAILYERDREEEVFSLIPERRRCSVAILSHFVPIFLVTLAVFLALWASEIHGTLLRELAALILYALACTGFCLVVRKICGGILPLGVLLPFLAIFLVVVCPIFVDLSLMQPLRFLFPVSAWCFVAYENGALVSLGIYAAVSHLLYFFLVALTKKT